MTKRYARIGFKDSGGEEQSLLVDFSRDELGVSASIVERHAFDSSCGEVVVWGNEVQFVNTDERTLKEAIYAWISALETLNAILYTADGGT